MAKLTISMPGSELHGFPVEVVKRVPRHGYVIVRILKGKRGTDYSKGMELKLKPSKLVEG